ncbi:NADH-quinone oxidoreductase subunit N [Calidifontibacter terrae]
MNIVVRWGPLLPVVIPAVAAVLVLLIDAFVPRRRPPHWVVALVALLGAVISCVPALTRAFDDPATSLCVPAGTCFYVVDNVGAGLQVTALGAALVVAVMAAPVRTPRTLSAVQTSALLTVAAGAAGVIAARDLASWLVLLELATLPTVALAAFHTHRRAADGALNLLITSLLSFAVTAMGVALWFAATGAATFDTGSVLSPGGDPHLRRVLAVAVMLIAAGVGFKISLVPFHAWTPQTYARSSIPIAALLATVSKVAAVGALLAVVRSLAGLSGGVLVAFGVIAAVSMTLGNVMALRETNTLRFLGWSSVSQGGWIVLPIAANSTRSVHAAAAYTVIYVVASLAIFAALTAAAHTVGRSAVTTFDRLAGFGRRRPLAAVALGLGLLTLAGLPPAINGAVAKIVALQPTTESRQWWLVVVAALNAMLGVAVYLRWILQIYRTSPANSADTGERSHGLHLLLVTVGTLALVVVSLDPQLLLGLLD